MLVKRPAEQRGGTESMEVILRQKTAGTGSGGEWLLLPTLSLPMS